MPLEYRNHCKQFLGRFSVERPGSESEASFDVSSDDSGGDSYTDSVVPVVLEQDEFPSLWL